MHLIDIHRLVLSIALHPGRHPLLIRPLILVQIPHHRSVIGAELAVIPVRIRFQHRFALHGLYLVLIDRPLLKAGNKQLENPGAAQLPHLVAPPVPKVKIPHYADPHSAGSPYGEIHALCLPHLHQMGAQLIVQVIVNPGLKLL